MSRTATAAPPHAGTVTLMFTDIEGSTRLLQNLGHRYSDLLTHHHAIMREAIAANNGREVDTAGDGFFVVFERARDAVAAAVQAQRRFAAETWPDGEKVSVRMGLHTGEPIVAGDGWVGLDVHRASRIASVASGGQVLLSAATRSLIRSDLPAGVTIRDLGRHALKDLREAEHLFQLEIEGLPSDFAPVGRFAGGLHNLPHTTTPLIGRERELAEIPEILLREDVRIVTLTGPGGTGKTRLALAVAQALSQPFEHGTWFVPLAPLVDASLVGLTIAHALGLGEQPSRNITDALTEFLEPRHILIVLDNFEQVTEAATLVAELLRRCPRLEVLVTSRGPLRITSEHEYPVRPLTLPDPAHWHDPDAIRHSAAVELFVQRARAARPDFELTAENAAAIAEICTRLDGLPLALELAAARIRLFSPPALLSRLGKRLDLLRGGARDLPERHQALRQTIAWSHELLNGEEQALFRRLSVFTGGCSLEAAEHVSQVAGGTPSFEVIDGITALVDRALVRRVEDSRGETRLVMLETIREFGLEQLEQSGEAPAVRRSHAMYFLALAEHAAQKLTGPDVSLWCDRLEAEHDNLRAAMNWAEEQRETELALRLGIALWRFMIIRGHMREGRHQLLRMLRISDAAKPDYYRARLLFGLGTLVGEISDFAEARGYFAECLAIARQLSDRRLVAESTTAFSWIDAEAGDFERGEALAREALELHRELDDRRGMALALNSLAWISLWRGDQHEAINRFSESMELRRQLGDRRGVAFMQTNVSLSFIELGRYDEAVRSLDEALNTFVMLRDSQLMAWNLSIQGRLHTARGDLPRARTLLQESVRLWRDVGNKFGIGWALTLQAVAESRAGDSRAAMPLIAEAEDILQESGARTVQSLCLRAKAEAAFAAGMTREAARTLRDTLELTAKLPDRIGIAFCLELAARLATQAREWIHAATFLTTAARIRRECEAPVPPIHYDLIAQLETDVREAAAEQFPIAREQAESAPLQDIVHVAQRFLRHLGS